MSQPLDPIEAISVADQIQRGDSQTEFREQLSAMSRISHSVASRNLRLLNKAILQRRKLYGMLSEPPRKVEIKQLIEKDTGKLVTDIA